MKLGDVTDMYDRQCLYWVHVFFMLFNWFCKFSISEVWISVQIYIEIYGITERCKGQLNIKSFCSIFFPFPYVIVTFTGVGPQIRGVTGKLFWGGKVIFPDFFLLWNAFSQLKISILVDPKQILVVLKSDKQKKGPFLILELFHIPFSIFHLPFYSFLLFFSIFTPFPFFSLPLSSQ